MPTSTSTPWAGTTSPALGADPLLDDTAKARFKARLAALAQEMQDAQEFGDPRRVEKLDSERDALIHGLTVAAVLGGRSR